MEIPCFMEMGLKCVHDSKIYPHSRLINLTVICNVEKNRNKRLINPKMNYNVHYTSEQFYNESPFEL